MEKYIEWGYAGGPNECAHGYAAGIPCPCCDEEATPHRCVYDSDVMPMQYGENLPPGVERYNSLFCRCGRVNHYGTWIPDDNEEVKQ